MKKINRTWRILLILLLYILTSNALNAQTTIGEVKSYMRAYGDWISSESKFADLVEDQKTSWWYRTFCHGYEYKIVAFSQDGDVNDMEIEVQYADGTSFSCDIDEWATVYVRPLKKAGVRMRMRMKNFFSEDPAFASKCYFIIFFREI